MLTPAQASKLLNVSKETLRLWEDQKLIQSSKTKGGHRRYHITNNFLKNDEPTKERENTPKQKNYIYARVSSYKQIHDLERQIEFLQSKFPNYEVISDIGSGLNFKRKGLLHLLEELCKGNVGTTVVAHKDRIARFGFDIIQFFFDQFGSVLQVIESPFLQEQGNEDNGTGELKDDLMAIITVFTAKYYGQRKYKKRISKDKGKQKRKTTTTRNGRFRVRVRRT